MKKLTYTTPAKFLKITLAKSYLNPIITGQFVKLQIQVFQNCIKSLIILAKLYYAAISSWSFKPYPYIYITNRLDHQKLIHPVKILLSNSSFLQEF